MAVYEQKGLLSLNLHVVQPRLAIASLADYCNCGTAAKCYSGSWEEL